MISSMWSNTGWQSFLSIARTAKAAAAKAAPSTIETHDSSSIADALLLSLTLADEVWEVLRECGPVIMIQLHTKQTPSHSLLWGEHHPLVGWTGKRQDVKIARAWKIYDWTAELRSPDTLFDTCVNTVSYLMNVLLVLPTFNHLNNNTWHSLMSLTWLSPKPLHSKWRCTFLKTNVSQIYAFIKNYSNLLK